MPPTVRWIATLALASTLAVGSARAEQTAVAGEPDHAGHPTEIVGIAATRLLPTVLVVPEDAAFGWLNYSSASAKITFDEDIAKKLHCRSPGAFRIRGAEIVAPQVGSGGFATLCSLAPGEYSYRVALEGQPEPLLGKLVVEGE